MPLARLPQVSLFHGSCLTHENWRLDCHQFEELRNAAGHTCQLCGFIGKGLVVDHDHALGSDAIRGVLCIRCNGSYIRRIDSGEYPIDPKTHAYLAKPWHLVREGRTLDHEPVVHVSVNDLTEADRQELERLHPDRRMSIFDCQVRAARPTFEHEGIAGCVAAADLRPVLRLLRMAHIWRRPDLNIAELGPHVPGGHAVAYLNSPTRIRSAS